MRRVRMCLGLAAAVLGLVTANTMQAEAATIALHQGSSNPTSEGFGLFSFNGGISASPISNDMGLAAWSITSTTPPPFQAAYLASLTSTQISALLSQGFTMSLDARAPNGPTFSPNNLASAAGIVGLSSIRFDLELGLDASGNTIAVLANNVIINGNGTFSTPGASVTLPGNTYHLYQLAYNPNTMTADLFIDGVDRIQGYSGHSDNPFTGFYFGALNQGQGNFNLASLQTGFAIVPEPSSLLMGGTAALIVLGYCWRSRKRPVA